MSQISNPREPNSINVDANRIAGASSEVSISSHDNVDTMCKNFTEKVLVTTAPVVKIKISAPVKVRRENNALGAPSSSRSDSLRCMRHNCTQKSKNHYNKCFCSEECQDIVFENSHSAGVVLIGFDSVPYTVILKGRLEDRKSNEEWEAPGGVRERGLSETAIGCAIRECVEETGMVVKVDKMAKYLLHCPMAAMPIKNGTHFSGIYHLAIFAHIAGFNDLDMHKAWISRMDRYTRKEVSKSGHPVVRSDCVDMKYSTALDLEALWTATASPRSRSHPRKTAKVLQVCAESSPGAPASGQLILCYRDYWSMSRIRDRGLVGAVIAMPTLEQSGIWDKTFIS